MNLHIKATLTMVIALAGAIPAAAATLVADYKFNGNFNSSVGGAPVLIETNPLGTGGFVSDVVSGPAQTVYHFDGANIPTANQGGLTFDNSGGLISNNSYSIKLQFKFDAGNNAWRRIVDVQNRQSDNGFYVDPGNRLDVFPIGAGGNVFTTGAYHNVLLVNNAGTVKAYLDGALSFTLGTTVLNINNPANVVNLFLDNVVAGGQGEWSSGNIARAQFYDGAFSPGVPEPAAWGLMLVGFGLVGGAMRRRRQSVRVTYA